MLTGDKGKTAKMIGIQCGMFSVTEKSSMMEDNELKTASKLMQKELEIEEEKNDEPKKNEKASQDGNEVILYEVNDNVTDIDKEIQQILKLSSKASKSKIELLVDGNVFAKMLTAS